MDSIFKEDEEQSQTLGDVQLGPIQYDQTSDEVEEKIDRSKMKVKDRFKDIDETELDEIREYLH